MAGEDSNSRGDRRRGVSASRVKLNQALAASDLPKKTQSALADKIADIERLDVAPKDLVSRVFRGVPVDAQSLERIARALNVPADSLYEETSSSPAPPNKPVAFHAWLADAIKTAGPRRLAAGVALVAAGIAATGFVARPESHCAIVEAFASPRVSEGKLGVLIAGFDRDESNLAQERAPRELICINFRT